MNSVPNYFIWGSKQTTAKYTLIDQIIYNKTGEIADAIPVTEYEDKDYNFFIKRSDKCVCFASVFRASYDATLVSTILSLLARETPIENLIGGKKLYRLFVFYNAQFLSRNALKILANYMKKSQNTYNRVIIESDSMSTLTEEIAPYVKIEKVFDIDPILRSADVSAEVPAEISIVSKSQIEKFGFDKFQTKEQTINSIVDLLFTSTNNIAELFEKIKEIVLTLWTSNIDYVQFLQMLLLNFKKREISEGLLLKVNSILVDTDIMMKKDCYNDYTHIQNTIYQIYSVLHKV